jgi:hypothetical protein
MSLPAFKISNSKVRKATRVPVTLEMRSFTRKGGSFQQDEGQALI